MAKDTVTEALRALLNWLGPSVVRADDLLRLGQRLARVEALVDELAGARASLPAAATPTPKPAGMTKPRTSPPRPRSRTRSPS